MDLTSVNHDTKNALNALGKIFDKKTVEERQALANALAKEGNRAIGDIASKQYQDNIKRVILAEITGNQEVKENWNTYSGGNLVVAVVVDIAGFGVVLPLVVL